MATIVKTLRTVGPHTGVFARVKVRGSGVPVVARAAMSLDIDGSAEGLDESGWQLDVDWDLSWDNPVVWYDDGSRVWGDGPALANVVQVTNKPARPSNGGGAFVVTVTVTATPGGAPVVGAMVRFNTVGGSDQAVTDGTGVATFNLDVGTYQLGITKAGFTFAPVSVDVVGAGNFAEQMTAVGITPSADLSQTTGYLTTRDGSGNPQGNVTILFRLVGPVGATGTAFDGRDFPATSDGNGLLQVALMQSKHYKARHAAKANSDWVDIPNTGTGSTFQLPEILSGAGS